jgi:hypothetical protein
LEYKASVFTIPPRNLSFGAALYLYSYPFVIVLIYKSRTSVFLLNSCLPPLIVFASFTTEK